LRRSPAASGRPWPWLVAVAAGIHASHGYRKMVKKMKLYQVFPVVLTLLMGCAFVVSLVFGRWLDAAYWLGGFMLNLSVIMRG